MFTTPLTLCFLVLTGTLAQTAGVLPPEGATVERIVLDDGTVIFGVVEDERGPKSEVIFDTPWAPQPPQKYDDEAIVRRRPERDSDREERHAEGWQAAGRVRVERAGGENPWVPKEELARAEQARQKALAIVPGDGPTPFELAHAAEDAAGAEGEPASGEVAGPPNAFLLWGPHALLGVAVIVLAGLVVRTLVLA